MRTTRKYLRSERTHEIALKGRRHSNAAANSLQFLIRVEGVTDLDGHVRGANGIRWRLA
jgi:hypothetical protein